ncbi:unnamed protein product, partial [Menidia menidia]
KKQRRAALKKERRKRKRQALALGLANGAEEVDEIKASDSEDDDAAAEEERQRLHEEWLERERLAQEEFRLRSEREDAARKRKEDEERMIKDEWDARQRREEEEKEQKQQEKRDRELDNGGPWMNPEAPVTVNPENFGTERDVANCPFFLKTGSCRFGERCSRKHVYPTASPTLMVRGMFRTFGMEELRRDDYDMDACLEHSEEELQESFLEFYHDVLPEFKQFGKVVQFKVCCNYEPHLRGNVYIQFETEDQCKEALMKFNGRWYAGRQLHCEICPVTRWKNAICGLFDRKKCPKGKHCNFLHVFRNPGNEFWEADRDLCLSPDRSVRGSRRDGWHSQRLRDRSWRQRRYSRSPDRRSERSDGRREEARRRSRSRERRSSYQHGEGSWSSRSRRGDSWTDRRRSKERSRSRSRDKEQQRPRDKEYKRRDRCEDRDGTDEDAPREGRKKSRSTSREKKRKQSKEKSPKKSDKRKRSPTDDSNTHRRHKRSKKNKKSKKKHKKKSPVQDATASSGESQEETVDNPLPHTPSGDLTNPEIRQEKCVEDDLSQGAKSELAGTEMSSELNGNSKMDSSERPL